MAQKQTAAKKGGNIILRFFKASAAFFAAVLLCSAAAFSPSAAEQAARGAVLSLDAAAVLLCEAETGTVLYENNADTPLPPASVTKIMTLLLTMEAIDGGRLSLDDTVTVSDYAASMGGSQVFLEPGEQMSVSELIKCVAVASANDAAVALAETVAGSEESFVERMNERAAELGMATAHFENVTGLDDSVQNHLLSARDIALMSCELLRHPIILQYSGIWTDSIRNGAFGLTNTNRLIRFYSGATGLKTGSTSKAHFCISATAKRDGMHLVAVVMGSPTRDVRNECAKKLLDYGFANHSFYCYPSASDFSSDPDSGDGGKERKEDVCFTLPLDGGTEDVLNAAADPFRIVLGKGEAANVTVTAELPESVSAPVRKGDTVGRLVFRVGERVVGETPVRSTADAERIGFSTLLFGVFRSMLLK